MNKTKVKNLNEAKIAKAQSLFGKDFSEENPYVNYEIDGNQIRLKAAKGFIEAEFTKTSNEVINPKTGKPFEVLREINVEINHDDKVLKSQWYKDAPDVYIVQRLINSLIAVTRTSKSSLNSEEQQKLAEEIALYKKLKSEQ